MIDPRRFASRISVVTNTHASAIPRFRKSSFVITSSVSQLLYSCVSMYYYQSREVSLQIWKSVASLKNDCFHLGQGKDIPREVAVSNYVFHLVQRWDVLTSALQEQSICADDQRPPRTWRGWTQTWTREWGVQVDHRQLASAQEELTTTQIWSWRWIATPSDWGQRIGEWQLFWNLPTWRGNLSGFQTILPLWMEAGRSQTVYIGSTRSPRRQQCRWHGSVRIRAFQSNLILWQSLALSGTQSPWSKEWSRKQH